MWSKAVQWPELPRQTRQVSDWIAESDITVERIHVRTLLIGFEILLDEFTVYGGVSNVQNNDGKRKK